MLKRSILSVAVAAISATALAEDVTPLLESMTIIGSSEQARRLSGSGAVVGAEQMDIEVITDINQALKTVPGIYIREEDGNGLRPNIGIRGATGDRSGKVTLLEDGVMIAPAPYSGPSAYYFPTAMRMNGVEVLKGAPLLRHGPQTTGGVINMLSTAIPAENSGRATLVTDENGSLDAHVNYGGTEGQWGWLVETVQRNNEGFKDIDRSARDTGFDIQDYVAKLRWQGERQSVLLKTQYSEEESRETYLGLTDTDFDDDANRRYGLSDIDLMKNRHFGANLTHTFEWTDNIQSTATYYRNEFTRDWFKLDKIDGVSAGKVVASANTGNLGDQSILDGDSDVDNIAYKHNDRDYLSEGFQFNVDIALGKHQLAVGARYHEDEVDRYQPTEIYSQINGSLVYDHTDANVKDISSSNNRFEESEALSLWITDSWQLTDALNINLAVRYEDVDSKFDKYADNVRSTVASSGSNSTEELLPGISFSYDLNDNWQALAGFHQGFAPLGGSAEKNQDPETSDNWEAGVRFQDGSLFAEAIAFYSDFSNKVEYCSVGSPCDGDITSGSLSNGAAEIQGIELQMGASFDVASFVIPVDAAYTYTEAEVTDAKDSGNERGDQLIDVPENVFSLRVGLEHGSGWNNYAVAKYVDEVCVSTGCNNGGTKYDKTEDLFVVDYISRYRLKSEVEVFMKVENVFDEQRIVSRTPHGARPNKPRIFSVGMTYDF